MLHDGAVVNLEDGDGDVVMRDAPPLRSGCYDGTSSLPLRGRWGGSPTFAFEEGIATAGRYVGGIHGIEMRDEDEGYWSGDGSAAAPVPPLGGCSLLCTRAMGLGCAFPGRGGGN